MSALLRAVIFVVVAMFATASAVGCATAGANTKSSVAKKKRTKKPQKKSSAVAANGIAAASGDSADADDDDGDDGDDGDDAARDGGELTAIASEGAASYYHDSLSGRLTASGAKYDPESSTCAHRSLPFGTVLVIENVQTGKKSHCTVNDRGPYVEGRLIDVSKKVARDLGMLNSGVIRVRIRVAKQPSAS